MVRAAVGHPEHGELIQNLSGAAARLKLLHSYAGSGQFHRDGSSHGRSRPVVFGGGAPQ